MNDNNNKIFVLDTNILLHESTAFLSFEEHDVVIPMTVIEELDNVKDRKADKSHDARHAIKAIQAIFNDATPDEITEGVQMTSPDGKDRGCISIINDGAIDLPDDMPTMGGFYSNKEESDPDFYIMRAALFLQKKHKGKRDVVLITKDINMRLRSKSMGIKNVADYTSDQVVTDIKFLTKGYVHFEGSFWEHFELEHADVETNKSKRSVQHEVSIDAFENPYLNQYLVDDSKKFAAKIVKITDDLVIFEEIGYNKLMGKNAWGIKPKNIHQGMAMDALLDEEVDLVMLTGQAGTGKTLLALATALEMVEKGKYNKIIVTRSTPEIAESIGFLPGTEEEKMAPWLAAITDSLEALQSGGNENKEDAESNFDRIAYIRDKVNMQFKSINFMRGRSIQNAIVLLDECQNLTPSQMKTIITRCGENTKLVCLGNLSQIDSNYITPITSGLTHVVERFKGFEGSTIVNLSGGVRSRLATYAEENL
jgi:PhoH-like ATPase